MREAVLVVDQDEAGRGNVGPPPQHEVHILGSRTGSKASDKEAVIAGANQRRAKACVFASPLAFI